MLRRALGIGLVLLLMAGSAVAGYFAANDDEQVEGCQELVRALELHVRAQEDGSEQFDYPFTDTANCFGED
jgi:hypothetical protein